MSVQEIAVNMYLTKKLFLPCMKQNILPKILLLKATLI